MHGTTRVHMRDDIRTPIRHMRIKKLLLLVFLLLVAFWAGAQDRSYADCLEKVRTQWGAPCDRCEAYTQDLKRDHSGTFQVELRNTCREIVEVKVAMQENNGSWRTFPVKAIAPGESMTPYACKGSGKYMYWARRINDQEVLLPTDRQIITQYR
jgi:hypothetical protein